VLAFFPSYRAATDGDLDDGGVWQSIGLPDVHSGYGFAIGNVAAFDMADPQAIVSPGAHPMTWCRIQSWQGMTWCCIHKLCMEYSVE
jgi:hypothetical protein